VPKLYFNEYSLSSYSITIRYKFDIEQYLIEASTNNRRMCAVLPGDRPTRNVSGFHITPYNRQILRMGKSQLCASAPIAIEKARILVMRALVFG
jgi:hypothetical protein